ncbi:hypothetical protein [Sphingobacterium siyangense]|uniref:hypothetical protein n=1 Tax=Sphingobacterium siyangense TaxID=459529 RepID=UPI003018A48D
MIATEIKAAQTILEKGSGLEIPAPFFCRLLGQKTLKFDIRKPTASTCLEIIIMRLQMKITDEEFENMTIEQGLTFMAQHGNTVAQILAKVILSNQHIKGVTEKGLAKMLLKYFPFSFLMERFHEVTLGSGLEDFMNFIGCIKTVRLTQPSHEIQRS